MSTFLFLFWYFFTYAVSMEKKNTGYDVWKRVDSLKQGSLVDLSAQTGIDCQKIKNQRTGNVTPKADDLYKIAVALNTSMEYLLTGNDSRTPSIVDEVYAYMQEKMPSLLEDIQRQISFKKGGGASFSATGT